MTAGPNRRRLLLGTLALAVMLAGCLGFSTGGRPPADCSEPWSPRIEATEPKVAPGDHADLRIIITNVTGFGFGIYQDHEQVYYDWMNVESISPPPDRSADGSPPSHFYEECTHVEVEANVSIPSDTKPGEYRYTIGVVQNLTGKGDSTRQVFSINVTDN